MLTDTLFPWLKQLGLDEIQVNEETIIFGFSSLQTEGICPCCQQASADVHSSYQRRLADLPWGGSQVVLDVSVHKIFCSMPACPQKIFYERVEPVAVPYARRTQRLYEEQQQLGLALGGAVGARTAQRQGMPVSPATLLRQVRQSVLPVSTTPRKLGVDDWALRKGTSYGTILVDLERHQPVDLLPDRSAETLSRWLQAHPGVEMITRNRAKEFIEGASQGAPTAIQVADRFHLIQNLREMLQHLLERHQAALRAATKTGITLPIPAESDQSLDTVVATSLQAVRPPYPAPANVTASPVKQTKASQQREAHRNQRLARYQQVRALHAEGLSQRVIARQLHISIHVVRHFLQADHFPERATRRPVASKLDPFLPFLEQQLAADHDNALQLWRELRDQHGYKGSRALVSRWVAHHRHLCPMLPSHFPKPKRRGKPPQPSSEHVTQRQPILSARQAAWLLLRPPEELDEAQAQFRQRLCDSAPQIKTVDSFAHEFIDLLHRRSSDSFSGWLTRAEATEIPELVSFVTSLRSDYAAIAAALSYPDSNAQCEGQVNRLKLIKRSMYGRAKFDLLCLRVLLSGQPSLHQK